MNAVLQKLRSNDQKRVLLLDAPAEFEAIAKDFRDPPDREPKGDYDFVLAFAKSVAEARSAAQVTRLHLAQGGLFWLAYPKGTSKKYVSLDINRDTCYAAMRELGFQGVAMIAIDGDWSAMRFKRSQ